MDAAAGGVCVTRYVVCSSAAVAVGGDVVVLELIVGFANQQVHVVTAVCQYLHQLRPPHANLDVFTTASRCPRSRCTLDIHVVVGGGDIVGRINEVTLRPARSVLGGTLVDAIRTGKLYLRVFNQSSRPIHVFTLCATGNE